MRRCLPVFALCLFVLIPVIALAQNDKDDDIKFPSDSDVKLIMTQARRAMEQYELAVQLEDQLLSSKGKEAVEKDKEVLRLLKVEIDALDQHPDKFSSVLGFHFVNTLDDASRNAHICSASAATFAGTTGMDKDYSSAHSLVALAGSCSNAGVLLYTVSESASALYVKYLKSMEQLAETATTYLTKCQEALKKATGKN
jgi:hypothetical protein